MEKIELNEDEKLTQLAIKSFRWYYNIYKLKLFKGLIYKN